MERKGARIQFNPDEQGEYGVSADVSIESALATAEMFKLVATRLDDRAKALHDKANRDIGQRSQQLSLRAGKLSTFAVGIEHLCAPEIDAAFLNQLDTGA